MKADLHTHTWYSPDGMMPPDLLIRVAKRRGLRVLAITDHNRLTHVPGREDIILVPGEEVMTSRGELIGLGITEEIPPGLDPLETADLIEEQGGVVVVPHPFDWFRPRTALFLSGVEMDRFHVVEVLNARYIDHSPLVRAYVYARGRGLPMVGSSDAHTPWEVGRACSLLPDDIDDVCDVLIALRKGRCRPFGRLTPPLIHVLSPAVRALHLVGLFKPRGAPPPVKNR